MHIKQIKKANYEKLIFKSIKSTSKIMFVG
jgi:hypothetical protein